MDMASKQKAEAKQKDSIPMKRPKTYDEQVALIQNKGFIVDNEEECAAFLHKANYYRLSAYFLPFQKKDGTYFPNTRFHRVQRIYEFDGKVRSVLFQCIEEIEFYLRTQLAYFSGHNHGTLGYLDEATFSDRHNHERFIALVDERIEENKRTLIVKHHKKKYGGKFPIWVIIEFFSMGMLSYFYGDLKTEEQKILAKEMYGTSPNCLKSWLRCITDLRNRCAHYSRLYYFSFPALPKLPPHAGFIADHRLFTQIMVLKFLYPEPEKWNANPFTEIEALVEGYKNDILLKHIGFPENWKELLQ